jgi:thymidylate synthase
LLAKEANLEEGELVGVLSDCHLYSNQIDASKELLERPTFPLPQVSIPDNWGGIWEWDYTKVVTENYQCGEKLSMGVTV